MKKFSYVFFLVGALACVEDPDCTRQVSQAVIDAVDQTRLAQDIATIDTYLADESITATVDPSGVRYVIETEGTGKKPCLENNISVKYVGTVMSSGVVFDVRTVPTILPLSNLILGWQLIVPQLGEGTKVTLYIPSGYAYGASVRPSIPANSNLIFEIELIDVP
jgi:FKBP-type peptidyl-prolyl cis-trans isomerase